MSQRMVEAKPAVRSKPAAGAARTRAPARPSRAGALAGKLGVLALIGVALSQLPLCLIAVPGMTPALAAFVIDRRRPRYLTCTVALMNFAGVLPFLLVAAQRGTGLAGAAAILAVPLNWIIMYGAAAIGWLTWWGTPLLARICIEVQAGQRRRSLEGQAAAIREEWGNEVAGEPPKG